MPGRSVYATMLNDAGKFIDDCVIYRMGPNSWLVVAWLGRRRNNGPHHAADQASRPLRRVRTT